MAQKTCPNGHMLILTGVDVALKHIVEDIRKYRGNDIPTAVSLYCNGCLKQFDEQSNNSITMRCQECDYDLCPTCFR